MSELPKVTVVATEQSLHSAQSQKYSNIKVVHQDTVDTAKWFNVALAANRAGTDLFIFLDSYHWFINENAVATFVDKFIALDRAPAAMYSDIKQTTLDGYMPQYFPPFHKGQFLSQQLFISTPLCVQAQILPDNVFDEKLNYLYYFKLLKQIASTYLLVHIPTPLIWARQYEYPSRVQEELQLVGQ